ncbi:predicted protein, partial [Nematostella vectensis]
LLYTIVLVFAIAGNGLLILIIYKNANRRMRTASNLFILNMAASDLLLVLWGVPVALKLSLSGPEWLIPGALGNLLCKICEFVWHVTVFVCTGSLTAIAFDRFLLVFYPMQRILTNKRAVVIIIAIWVISTMFSIPVLYFTSTSVIWNRQYCFMDFHQHESLSHYIISLFAIFIATPLLVLIVLYDCIIIKLWLHKTPGDNPSRERTEQTERTNVKIHIMLTSIVITFALCWLPYWISNIYCFMYKAQSEKSDFCQVKSIEICVLFSYINTAANPLIYFIFSGVYRKAVKSMFC